MTWTRDMNNAPLECYYSSNPTEQLMNSHEKDLGEVDGSIPTVYADTETPSSSVLQHTQTAVAIPNTD